MTNNNRKSRNKSKDLNVNEGLNKSFVHKGNRPKGNPPKNRLSSTTETSSQSSGNSDN